MSMTRADLIDVISRSIAKHEGYGLTQAEALARNMRWPTRAQRNKNPGNLRGTWNPKGKHDGPDPKTSYMIFDTDVAGWMALQKLCSNYLDGKYHKRLTDPSLRTDKPSLWQWFRVYAPAEDANNPASYAAGVAADLRAAGVQGVGLHRPVVEYIDA